MLNQSQEAAASHGSGPCLVVAGPGSGKTTVLTECICYLVQEAQVPPEQIMVVTFTREAAAEMRRRYLWKAKSSQTKVTFGTFHSIFFQILKEEYHYQTSDILMGNRRQQLLEACRKELRIAAPLQEVSKEERLQIQRKFDAKKDAMHLLDFDDMIGKTRQLLLDNQHILQKWQNRYQYFLVDEMQDMSDGQYEILRMLAAPRNNLYMVGDDDQAIYGFRGANPSIMLGFPTDYPDAKQIVLHINYRCRKNIVSCAHQLIANNQMRFSKEISAASKKDGMIRKLLFPNPEKEAVFVAEEVERMLQSSPTDTIGILYRNRLQSMFLMEQCRQREIAFYTKDSGGTLLRHWITQDVRAYLRMAYDVVRREDLLLVANKPYRGFPSYRCYQTFVDLSGLAMEMRSEQTIYAEIRKLQRDLEALGKLRPFAAVTYLFRGMGYERFLQNYASKKGVDMAIYRRVMEELLELSKSFTSGSAWVDFLFQEMEEKPSVGSKTRLHFDTYHGSKGLEFDRVILLDVNEGITPSKRATEEKELEEERRMFYVALTRAKKELVLCTIEQRANELLYPSRFLQECGIYASSDASSNI